MDPADQPHQLDPRTSGPDRAEPVRDQGAEPPLGPSRLFRFSQLELPWALGPPDGRYMLRDPDGGPDAAPAHVLVLSTLGARERRRLRRRRMRRAPAEPEAAPVPTARTTIIDVAAPFTGTEQARAWLKRVGEDDLAADVAVLNRALHAHRLVTADPHVNPVSRGQALVARVGFGEGVQVAFGKWTEARELIAGAPRRRRRAMLVPHARLAAVLGGRDRPLVSEELALRARLDLDHGRHREAALQMLIALDAALAELQGDAAATELADRLDELRGERDPIAAAAQAALAGPLSPAERETVAFALGRIEAAFRARTAPGSRGRAR
jgi:hypothetical protein